MTDKSEVTQVDISNLIDAFYGGVPGAGREFSGMIVTRIPGGWMVGCKNTTPSQDSYNDVFVPHVPIAGFLAQCKSDTDFILQAAERESADENQS